MGCCADHGSAGARPPSARPHTRCPPPTSLACTNAADEIKVTQSRLNIRIPSFGGRMFGGVLMGGRMTGSGTLGVPQGAQQCGMVKHGYSPTQAPEHISSASRCARIVPWSDVYCGHCGSHNTALAMTVACAGPVTSSGRGCRPEKAPGAQLGGARALAADGIRVSSTTARFVRMLTTCMATDSARSRGHRASDHRFAGQTVQLSEGHELVSQLPLQRSAVCVLWKGGQSALNLLICSLRVGDVKDRVGAGPASCNAGLHQGAASTAPLNRG
jgi:hypothetical protein